MIFESMNNFSTGLHFSAGAGAKRRLWLTDKGHCVAVPTQVSLTLISKSTQDASGIGLTQVQVIWSFIVQTNGIKIRAVLRLILYW